MGVGGAEDDIANEFGGNDLGDDVLVGEPDHETVLGGVVLVLGLYVIIRQSLIFAGGGELNAPG